MTTIDEALDAFLAEQEERLSERTFRTYREVIDLFRRCMNDYGRSSLSAFESKRWEKAYEEGDGDAYTHLFGPEKIPAEVGQFLGWYVIRKVMAGQELARACGTVTKKLGKWLESKDLIDADAAADMVDRGGDATDELPKAEKLSDLLYRESRKLSPNQIQAVSDRDWIEDQLLIDRVESANSGSRATSARSGSPNRPATWPVPGGGSPSPWPGSRASGASPRLATSTPSREKPEPGDGANPVGDAPTAPPTGSRPGRCPARREARHFGESRC